MARSFIYDFFDLPVGDDLLTGTAEIEYSRKYSGFHIADITLDLNVCENVDFPPAEIAKALEASDRDGIEFAIREDQDERDTEYREERGRPMLAAE